MEMVCYCGGKRRQRLICCHHNFFQFYSKGLDIRFLNNKYTAQQKHGFYYRVQV